MIKSYRKGSVLKKTLALLLAFSIPLMPIPGMVSAAHADDIQVLPANSAEIHSILLFPVSSPADNAAIGSQIDDAIRLKLAAVNKYKITRFSKFLPSVQRALDDKDLTAADISTPFADDDKDQARAEKIAKRLDFDAYFVGNVDSYKTDPATRKVSLQLTGTLYLTDKGTAAKSIGASVNAVPVSNSDQLDTVIAGAISQAAAEVASGINSLPVEKNIAKPKSSRHANSVNPTSVLAVVLAGALIYAATRHDSSSSSSSGTVTPPPSPF